MSDSLEIKTEIPEDCACDANVFYKKYKSQIDALLAQHLADKKAFFAEQKKALDAKRGSFISARGKRKPSKIIKPMPTDMLDFQIKAFDESKTHPPPVRKPSLATHGSRRSVIEKKVSEHVEQESKVSEHETEIIESIKEDEEIELSEKEVQPEAVDFYELALDDKLRHLFDDDGGEEEEAHTEHGYLIFDRFVDRSEASTAYKFSSISGSGEEMGDFYPFHPEQFDEEWMSESMRRALDYLKRHHIGDLFKFLGAHLVSANPCNPIDFLINLLDLCMNYRSGFCDPPLLYLPKHIESLFNSMDPMETGLIEVSQYHTGMFTLGIREYHMFPQTIDDNFVAKHVFLNEAFNRLRIQLNEMIRSWETPITTITTFTPFYSIRAGESMPQ